MIKLWSLLYFLVLVTSSVCRGQNETTAGNRTEDVPAIAAPPPFTNETQNESVAATTPPPSPLNHTSTNATDPPPTAFTTKGEERASSDDFINKTDEEKSGGTAQTTVDSTIMTQTGGGGVDADVTTPTGSSSSPPVTIEGSGHSSWGYVILVLIILVIFALCVILFFLRRVSRTYSFDLHRQIPTTHLNEPTGTFEPVYLDDLERPFSKDQVTTDDDLSPRPVSNGKTPQMDERGCDGESAPQDANGLETSPTSNTSNTSNTSPSLGDEPADGTPSPLSSTNLFFDAIGEEQLNENNNNPSVCSSDPFVEINLDEPAFSNQLLASPEAPSSVLPFSPFSFSSSSTSSSSSSS